MRSMINLQAEFDFHPSNLKITQKYYAKYEAVSRVLDQNPKIVALLHKDLEKPLKYAATKGTDGKECKFTSDNVLRILLCQVIEGLTLREVVVRIDDSHFLRRFVRIYNGAMMDFTTLDKLKNSIRPKTWRRVNRLLAKHAVQEELISREALRLDTTAVETHIHWPTDSALLWDVYRVLARGIEQAREIDPDAVGTRRLHTRRAKRFHAKIGRQATKKGQTAAKLKPLYERLIGMVEGILEWSQSVGELLQEDRRKQKYGLLDDAFVQALVEEIEEYAQLGKKVVEQTRRRVLEDEQVPNDEKLFSIFEPHTELLKRGKAGKDIEFGHMIQLQQVREKFITDYDVFQKKPVEYELLKPALESHRELFGKYPCELAADKSYYENAEALKELRRKVKIVSIAKKGRRTVEEIERESDPLFRHAQCFRAGIEGTISFLKRVLRLWRCFNKGWEHFLATVGTTIFAHNLLILARS